MFANGPAPEVSPQGVRSAVNRLVAPQPNHLVSNAKGGASQRLGKSSSAKSTSFENSTLLARAQLPAETVVREITRKQGPATLPLNGSSTSNNDGQTLLSMEERALSISEQQHRSKLMDVMEEAEKSHKSPTEGLVMDASCNDGSTDMWVDGASDSDPENFDDEALARRVLAASKRRQKCNNRNETRSRRRAMEDNFEEADLSSDEEFCWDCGHHRHYNSHKHNGSQRGGRSCSRSKRSDSDKEGVERHLDHTISSKTRSKSKKTSTRSDRYGDSRRSEHASKDRSHRGKKALIRDAKTEKEVSSRKDRTADKKRSHSKGRSGSLSTSKKSLRDVDFATDRNRKESRAKADVEANDGMSRVQSLASCINSSL